MRETRKISFMPYNIAFVLLGLLIIACSYSVPPNYFAFAHTFSSSESADFLSLVEQIKAETQLVSMNLENNNVTLAQAHAQKASALLDNFTIGEIRERNNRIADSLESGLRQLEANVTSLTSVSQEEMTTIPPDAIQRINESVMSLNDTISEAVTVRVESDQQDNATMWALVLADLVNTVLSDYGNATGASFDLTEMSNLAGMGGMQTDNSDNMTMMMMTDESMQMSDNSSGDNMTTMGTNFNSSTSNMTTTIVDEAGLPKRSISGKQYFIQLFSDTLKPLTISTNETAYGSDTNTTAMTQEGQETSSPERYRDI